jgi:hypothetical protein
LLCVTHCFILIYFKQKGVLTLTIAQKYHPFESERIGAGRSVNDSSPTIGVYTPRAFTIYGVS